MRVAHRPQRRVDLYEPTLVEFETAVDKLGSCSALRHAQQANETRCEGRLTGQAKKDRFGGHSGMPASRIPLISRFCPARYLESGHGSRFKKALTVSLG